MRALAVFGLVGLVGLVGQVVDSADSNPRNHQPAPSTQLARPAPKDLLDRYPSPPPELSFLKTERDFEQFREQYIREATAWMRAGDAASLRRREFVAATVGLEVAHAAFDVAWPQSRKLIEWGSELLRRPPKPDEGERLWHLAALPLIQGAFDYRLMIQQKDDVWLKRLPNEPRLLLALLVMLEGDTWPEPDRGVPWDTDEASLEKGHKMFQARRANRSGVTVDMRAKSFEYQRRASIRQVITLLEDLSNSVDIRADAILRLGVLHLRLRHPDVARDQFEDVLKLTGEPFLVYLAQFFRGATLEQDGDRAEAIRAYRAALAVMPRAQAASFALASLLFLQDQREEASAIIDAAIQLPTAPDPWRGYQSGDYRLWPERISELRKALQ
jgi:tetratricopeptide (TPR) repeat protein